MLRQLLWLVALEGTAAALAALLRAWKAFAAVTAAQLPINIALMAFLVWGQPGDIQLLVQGTLVGTACKTLWLVVAVGRKLPLWRPFRFEKRGLADFFGLAMTPWKPGHTADTAFFYLYRSDDGGATWRRFRFHDQRKTLTVAHG